MATFTGSREDWAVVDRLWWYVTYTCPAAGRVLEFQAPAQVIEFGWAHY